MRRDVVVEWVVKRSLLDYMQCAADFAVEVGGGATFDLSRGVRIPAVADGKGAVRLRGAVTLSAHQGALVVPIVDGLLADGALTIADPGGATGDRLALVDVEEADEGVDGGRVWRTRLSPEADDLFRYNYLPRAAFADIVVRSSS